MKFIRKFLILSHRYLGIAISLLVVMWFATGIVMMYAGGMPALLPEVRLERLGEVDLSQVKLTPAQAARIASGDTDPAADPGPGPAGLRRPGRTTLLTVLGRPAYRLSNRGVTTVFADTGEVMEEIDLDQSKTVAAKFASIPVSKVRFLETIDEVDQWTLGQARQMPLHHFAVDDGEGTELYVSPAIAEVVMITTSHTRLMAWLGTIPHWFYFTALRTQQTAWTNSVNYTSGLVCVLALLGIGLGFTQYKWGKPFASAVPYSGWMRWHYITGVFFGIFTLTWAFSGLLSMEPFAWTQAEGLRVRPDVFTGGPVDLAKFPSMEPAQWSSLLNGHAVKEVSFIRLHDNQYFDVEHAPKEVWSVSTKRERLHQPYYITGRSSQRRLLVNAATMEPQDRPFTAKAIVGRIKQGMPKAKIIESELLTNYDSYYYSRGRRAPLPVVRVKFADPGETWLYVEPARSQVLASIPRLARLERWLYNGLHSLDFAFWYDKRPLWDIGMLFLLAGGLMSSIIGLCLGLKRLVRGATRLPHLAPSPSADRPREMLRPS